MSDTSAIEWTDATWNALRGCTPISPGCKNCYAMAFAGAPRLGNPGKPYAGLTVVRDGRPVWTGDVRFAFDKLDEPLRWKLPRQIFVNSMSDIFHEAFEDEVIAAHFGIMALCPQHTFQVLTKRARRMREWFDLNMGGGARALLHECVRAAERYLRRALSPVLKGKQGLPDPDGVVWPLRNVHLGVSVESQPYVDERVPPLLETPAARRFVSYEPALGAINIGEYLVDQGYESGGPCGWVTTGSGLDWVIAGGESGRNARPCHPTWIRSVRDQCLAAKVPFFFKQWGAWAPVAALSEEALDALYLPAPERDPEATRNCRVETGVLGKDGLILQGPGAFEQSRDPHQVFLVGKKRAGRKLDGRTWDEHPAAAYLHPADSSDLVRDEPS